MAQKMSNSFYDLALLLGNPDGNILWQCNARGDLHSFEYRAGYRAPRTTALQTLTGGGKYNALTTSPNLRITIYRSLGHEDFPEFFHLFTSAHNAESYILRVRAFSVYPRLKTANASVHCNQ